MEIKNLEYFRSADPTDPKFGIYLHEALKSIARQAGNYELQGNLNPNGQPEAPPNIQGFAVTGQNGFFHASIVDQSENLKRGVNYVIEHADNPYFINAQKINLGDTRAHTAFLGNSTRYFRAYSHYLSGQPSAPAYHGGSQSPAPVSAGGVVGGPALLPSQGAGTGAPAQGLAGAGPVPLRTASAGFDWTAQPPTTSTPVGNQPPTLPPSQ